MNSARMSPDPTPPAPSGDVTDDAALGGRLRLLQPRRGHRFGHDAILLAAATEAHSGDCVVDLGAGVGAAGLALAVRCPGTRVTLVDIDAQLVALATENAKRNALDDRVSAVTLDVAASAKGFSQAGMPPDAIDRVLMNPPFHDADRSSASPDAARKAAHIAPVHSLDVWTTTALRLLRPGGVLTLIYRADALADVLSVLARGFGSIEVIPVQPKPDAPAIRVIIRAVKGSRAPLVVQSGLVLNDDAGRPSAIVEQILRGSGALTFGR
jgi:tRNA1(Val) A37 N6-methylase TrmN6